MRLMKDNLLVKASNRLKHGLSSRAREEGRLEEAIQLARELIGDVPVAEEILSTATALAQTIFLLQAIAAERKKILSTPAPPPHYDQFLAAGDFEDFRQDVIDSGFCKDPPRARWAESLLRVVRYPDQVATYKPSDDDIPRLLRSRRREICRVDEYERKARARRYKLSNRLDYLILESKRQRLKSTKPADHTPNQ